MPHIRPITDLRNTTEMSELCHSLLEGEAVFKRLREKYAEN
jgi:hypothetical protein